MRYRYESGRWTNAKRYELNGLSRDALNGQSNLSGSQDHRIRVRAGAKADIGAGFKVYGQLQYGNDRNGGYGKEKSAVTNGEFDLRQAYVQYDSDYNLGFIAGRQQLNTLWTSDIVGFAAKGYYTGVEGLTLAAFAVDSFEQDGDRIFGARGSNDPSLTYDGELATDTNIGTNYTNKGYRSATEYATDYIFKQNFYGAAAVGSFDIGFGSLDPQLWLGYLNNRAFFYALDVNFNLPINDDLSWSLRADYLGNSVTSDLKNTFASYDTAGRKTQDNIGNGNFFNLAGTIKAYGFDGTLGGLYYGKEKKFTVNTIEDTGNFGFDAGREIFYLKGSNLTNSFGKNTFVYGKAGYTFADLRVGAQIIYGGTETGLAASEGSASFGGGEKTEYVAEASYNLTKKINVQGWYSYIDYDSKTNNPDLSNKKNTVRLQATYRF